MKKSKKIAFVSEECVACGSCIKVCPLKAVSIPKGIRAIIDEDKCIGCGKCAKACPADVIQIIERGDLYVRKQEKEETLV
jgi:ferredoxin